METSEGSWNSSSHGALRLLVQHIAEAQGKGGVIADGLCDSEGVHSFGGTGMWGRDTIGWTDVGVWYLGLDHVDMEVFSIKR